MKILYRMFALAAITMVGAAHAANDDHRITPPEATVENFMVVSGIKESLDRLPADMAGMLFGNIPASVRESTKKALVEGYNGAYPKGSITAAVATVLKSGRDRARLPKMMKIVSSPVAMKMTALERKEPSQEELKSFAATLAAKPPGEKRVALLKELSDETFGVDVLAKITAATMESLALATSSGCADDMKRIRDEATKGRQKVREAVLANQLLGMAFIYRAVSDDELREYIATYKDPDSKALQIAISKLIVSEYLSRWKTFEKTLVSLGSDLSDRSMFAKSCRSDVVAAAAAAAGSPAVNRVAIQQPKRNPLSGKDAQECLKFEDNAKIMACAERYR